MHVLVAAAWLLVWAATVQRTRTLIDPRRFRRVVDRIAGAVLIALGVRAVATR